MTLPTFVTKARRSVLNTWDDFWTRRHLATCEQKLADKYAADIAVVAEALIVIDTEWERVLDEGFAEAQEFAAKYEGWGG